MEIPLLAHRPARLKLIFNPSSGASDASPAQLMEIITQLQAQGFVPEVYLVEPGGNLLAVIQDALHRSIRLFVVCGGDGTIDTVAEALVGKRATLGIIPIGTRNNLALSLGIPTDIPAAVALLRTGRRVKIDVGLVAWGEIERPFLEVCSVGMLSALFPAADDIQHGNLARVGDFLSTLIASPVAEMHLVLDKQKIDIQGHVVLVANMPYIGPRYPIVKASFCDGRLDVLIFSDLSKLDVLNNAVQMTSGGLEDPRIQHYQVKRLRIETNPPMPAMADGFTLGEGPLRIKVKKHALAVMVGEPVPAETSLGLEVTRESQPVGV